MNEKWLRNVSLRHYSSLKAGGRAERFRSCRTIDQLAEVAVECQKSGEHLTVIGSGSNILPSDQGVPGCVVWNATDSFRLNQPDVEVDCGLSLQELFLKAAQAKLGGLEFAVGIPGTVGGALVSNAGAYRSNISEFLTDIEVVFESKRQWVSPDFMEFSYRDSILRRKKPPSIVLLQVRMTLPVRDPKLIYDEARDYQRQRISKQPPSASAGSFFKNVVNEELALTIPGLTDGMRAAGVIPAGFLIEACGLKGQSFGGAKIGSRHANFLVNDRGATASEIRRLAEYSAQQVQDRFRVTLEEEVLYLGDWSTWITTGQLEA
jgi:UDP-N-acetylmuramate dehydrogenase